jgi:NitT/TauT family transport system ATP-binding protein
VQEKGLTTQSRDATALRFDRVSKVFPDGTHAVDDVSFEVAHGEFVTVVGPSGCGKSTLARIAGGLDTPTEGECRVDRSSIGYVFQDATLLPWRTLQRNVELIAELKGFDRAERHRRASAAIATVGLDGHQAKYPRQLSGGMKMRASVARSLVLEPELFLFDEPFGALDEITRERLDDELLALFAERHFAALFITHSIAEAVYMSTRVIVMSARPGRITGDFPVSFSYPRDPDLRFDPAFASLCGEVSHCLRASHS